MKGKDMSSRIKPIPSGFHTLTPHLVVKGASQAIEFYKSGHAWSIATHIADVTPEEIGKRAQTACSGATA